MSIKAYLGIDAGTQGLSAMLTDADLNILATGEGDYEMQPDLPQGCYEQNPLDWTQALQTALAELRATMDATGKTYEIEAIGISAQMHGEVLLGEDGQPLGHARLWCDARNAAESDELTARFGVKVAKRATCSRWLWTTRERKELAIQTRALTTPGGWLAFCLTGQHVLGVGDASGMFPVHGEPPQYDQDKLRQFDDIAGSSVPPLAQLLPRIAVAGEASAHVSDEAAAKFGLPAGIPVAPAEGDQPAALAGSLIADAGMISVSLGTSICANAVGDHAFEGIHPGIDHFCAADGKPINMVWLRNGTTFMNSLIRMFAHGADNALDKGFDLVMPQLLQAPVDCGGLLALPFMDDEPGLNVHAGGTASLHGLNADNATPGNVAKAALLAVLFNMRLGLDELARQRFPQRLLVLSGGLSRHVKLRQVIADALNLPVRILPSAREGCAWGAAILAKYGHICQRQSEPPTWSEFITAQVQDDVEEYQPKTVAREYTQVYARYKRLLGLEPGLSQVLTDSN